MDLFSRVLADIKSGIATVTQAGSLVKLFHRGTGQLSIFHIAKGLGAPFCNCRQRPSRMLQVGFRLAGSDSDRDHLADTVRSATSQGSTSIPIAIRVYECSSCLYCDAYPASYWRTAPVKRTAANIEVIDFERFLSKQENIYGASAKP